MFRHIKSGVVLEKTLFVFLILFAIETIGDVISDIPNIDFAPIFVIGLVIATFRIFAQCQKFIEVGVFIPYEGRYFWKGLILVFCRSFIGVATDQWLAPPKLVIYIFQFFFLFVWVAFWQKTED